jgi:hypothetical protein
MRPFDHIDFKSLIAKEINGRMRVRLMALSHIKEGEHNSQTARNLHIGYTNNKNHKFTFKNDFIIQMNKAPPAFILSDKYQEIINRYK